MILLGSACSAHVWRMMFETGQLRAATTDFGSAAGQRPLQWTPDTRALDLAGLFTYEVYPRASLYSDSYVTSSIYKAARTRDNQWIVFQHHTHWCAALLQCTWSATLLL
jgi:hypothetical protein